jgi:hypothetical protein
MNKILSAIAQVVYQNALEGAGSASIKGTYEVKVPATLQKK